MGLKFKDTNITLTDYYNSCHLLKLEDIILLAVDLNKLCGAKLRYCPKLFRMS